MQVWDNIYIFFLVIVFISMLMKLYRYIRMYMSIYWGVTSPYILFLPWPYIYGWREGRDLENLNLIFMNFDGC